MNENGLFPRYVRRDEEKQILAEAARVRRDRQSRAVLLYGPGGVGKTLLVRELARASAGDPMTVWADPIDIDDSEYWLLSNLERRVAGQLDPEERYFRPYLDYLSRLPGYAQSRVGHETVVSHLWQVKRVFVECYQAYAQANDEKIVVIVFDTVEAIRGMSLLLTLTQWMKALPATLFILAGRPLPGQDEALDSIRSQLEIAHQSLPVTTIHLGEFTQDAALAYLCGSAVAAGLHGDEADKLVLLARGHPLWLAFTIDCLKDEGLPPEAADHTLAELEQHVPYHGQMTPTGKNLHDSFMRRLVARYHQTDFWHESIKRLAIVRESMSQPAWCRLMADRPLPKGVSGLDEAWAGLLTLPWIRPRASRRYVTLHDAVAEELAQRIIPAHDQDGQWRCELWQRAAGIYAGLAGERGAELAGKLTALDERLQDWYARPGPGGVRLDAAAEESRFVEEAARLDAQEREVGQLQAARLYYELLCDYSGGCDHFLALFERARDDNDVLFQDLLAFEMQRFLPGGVDAYALGYVIGEAIEGFRRWLASGPGQEVHLRIGLSMADYLIKNEQPEAALELLGTLPEPGAAEGRYRVSNLRGNACMRIPDRVREGLDHFRQALRDAEDVAYPDRLKFIAKAHKELGFFYRNAGRWPEADETYRQARDAISEIRLLRNSDNDREEMASIQTNWAYVKGLEGEYRAGTDLVESAIIVRQRLKNSLEEGNSWSVCGEVYRYARRFRKAWNAYAEAERIFQEQQNWPWLGLVYQEQAICLYQAAQDGIRLLPDHDPLERARDRITLALGLCRDLAVRGYPSALNRAGRIFGHDDPNAGLKYLEEGIEWARALLDGWFWFANLIEYAELSYRAWAETGQQSYRDQMLAREADIQEVMTRYEFPDLQGRWDLLLGHLGIHDWLAAGDPARLDEALERYKAGFALMALRYVGSSGAAALPGEFEGFRRLFEQLPGQIRAEWTEEMRRAWAGQESGSILLLARLEELY